MGAIPIPIKIGEVTPLKSGDLQVVPDDRQSRIETIGGVVVQDFGHVEQGDTLICSIVVSAADAATLYSYWHNRTLITLSDERFSYDNIRVIVKSYQRVNRFPDFFNVELEFWRV